jgi:hypothetical protein
MKIKYSALVSDVRGKLNGSVASKNRYGAYLRNKVTPVNRRTTLQQNVRGSLSSISKAWRDLSETQRLGFNNLAAEVNKTNIFGDKITLSGAALFMRLNRNLDAIGETRITTAPAIPVLTSISSLSFTATASTHLMPIAFTISGTTHSCTLIVRATPQVSQGINFVKSEFRQLLTLADDDTSPYAAGSNYEAKFGSLVVGKKVFVSFQVIHTATGFPGGKIQAQAIVA